MILMTIILLCDDPFVISSDLVNGFSDEPEQVVVPVQESHCNHHERLRAYAEGERGQETGGCVCECVNTCLVHSECAWLGLEYT